ncbi:MAG: LapA family protein [Actinomycetota bacterium]|nr:LapA family protein [Actinomycetota bacterium]
MADRSHAAGGSGRQGPEPKELARLALALVVAILFIAFIIDNSDSVPVGFVFFTREPPLIWVLVVTFLLGAIVGYLLSAARARRRR